MTPEEKAKELYIVFKEALDIRHDMRPGANPFAKKCALIVVNEMQKLLEGIIHDDCWWSNSDYYLQNDLTPTQYLDQVKIEIESL